MNKRNILLFCIIGLFFVFLPQCSSETTIELRVAQPFATKHIVQTKIFEPWAKKIEELSGGRVKVTMFSGGALGKAADHYNLAEEGIADITYALQDYTPGRFPLTTVFELPFMIPSAEKTSVAMWKTFEEFSEFQEEYS
ncbi:MAG: hypothetical protein JW927_22930, partial [Deltaproteobacteria bacterium]|nr:hypothetical protein [Deltaproteobacteria bacterium]